MYKCNYPFLIVCCASPILSPMLSEMKFNAMEKITIFLILVFQLGILAAFFYQKAKWTQWLLNGYSCLHNSNIKDPISHFVNVFLDFNWFLFSVVLPYGTYMRSPLHNIQIFVIFFMAVMLWIELYLSGLHSILTKSISEPWKLCRLPYVSLILVIWIVNNPSPYEINKTVVFLICVYLIEIVLKLLIQRKKNS